MTAQVSPASHGAAAPAEPRWLDGDEQKAWRAWLYSSQLLHGPARPGAHPRDRDLARLLRDPRGPVGDAGPDDADERARRPLPLLPQPPLARGVPAGGARLGPAARCAPRTAAASSPSSPTRASPRSRRPRRSTSRACARTCSTSSPPRRSRHARHRRDPAAPPRPAVRRLTLRAGRPLERQARTARIRVASAMSAAARAAGTSRPDCACRALLISRSGSHARGSDRSGSLLTIVVTVAA